MRHLYFLPLCLILLFISCQEIAPADVSEEQQVFNLETDEYLKDLVDFPIGNVWSAGLPPWNLTKGTDLGGPADDFSYFAYGFLSSLPNKDIDLEKEFDILRNEFNSITPEVALKMHNIAVSPDSLDFRQADAMMEFAEENNIRVFGHVLLFDLSVPEWCEEYAANNVWTEEEWETWLEDYIKTVVGRYAGRIPAWDVLNEIIRLTGDGPKTDEYFWYRVIGPDYMKKALLWAEEADPDALLFINDNAQEFFPQKNNVLINVANDLRAQGCRVDGIGYQGHVIVPLIQGTYDNFKRAFKKAADNGYLVHLSELDLISNLLGTSNFQTALQARIQRKRYNEIARAYVDAVPPTQRAGITLWNVSDRNGWTNIIRLWHDLRIFGGNEDYPLLWDKNYNKKPAYFGFSKGIRNINEDWFVPLYSSDRQAANQRSAQLYPFENETEEYQFYVDESLKFLESYYGLSETRLQEMYRSAMVFKDAVVSE